MGNVGLSLFLMHLSVISQAAVCTGNWVYYTLSVNQLQNTEADLVYSASEFGNLFILVVMIMAYCD